LSILVLLKHLLKLHPMKELKLQSLLLVANQLLLLGHYLLLIEVVLLSHELVVLSCVVIKGEWGDAHDVLGHLREMVPFLTKLIDQLVICG